LEIAVIAGIDSGKIPAEALASMSGAALRHNNQDIEKSMEIGSG
jgi:hypothetical protein